MKRISLIRFVSLAGMGAITLVGYAFFGRRKTVPKPRYVSNEQLPKHIARYVATRRSQIDDRLRTHDNRITLLEKKASSTSSHEERIGKIELSFDENENSRRKKEQEVKSTLTENKKEMELLREEARNHFSLVKKVEELSNVVRDWKNKSLVTRLSTHDTILSQINDHLTLSNKELSEFRRILQSYNTSLLAMRERVDKIPFSVIQDHSTALKEHQKNISTLMCQNNPLFYMSQDKEEESEESEESEQEEYSSESNTELAKALGIN